VYQHEHEHRHRFFAKLCIIFSSSFRSFMAHLMTAEIWCARI